MAEFRIGADELSIEHIRGIADGTLKVSFPDSVRERVQEGRDRLEELLKGDPGPIYGINTGFGSLCDTVVPREKLQELQTNLLLSHACGTGEALPSQNVRLMLVFKAIALADGSSCARPDLIDRLLFFYEKDILPVVPEQGSLGASGDLAPLAHLCLPLIGRGEVLFKGREFPTRKVLLEYELESLELGPKEGLALLNGTQFMSAIGAEVVARLHQLSEKMDRVAALSVLAFGGSKGPFHPGVHRLRPHGGQMEVAERIRGLLEEQGERNTGRVQDPYSFRCIPQVHGASLDILKEVSELLLREIASVTDNPVYLEEEGRILSAGNFHGQPLAMAFDRLALAIAEWGSISERRSYKLLSGFDEVPEFLISEPGLHSGLMIPQYTAASLVSQNRQSVVPSSSDSIDSSNGQEDHVSMGANGAVRLLRMLDNLEGIAAIEMLNACQAVDLRDELTLKGSLKASYEAFRERVPYVEKDRAFYKDIREARVYVRNEGQ